VLLDVTSRESIAEAVGVVEGDLAARGLPLAALVNNAGVGYILPGKRL
jgi:NAD(P)-dependent dehydrogenase (short-subunit alcohol dehydrogenase family)